MKAAKEPKVKLTLSIRKSAIEQAKQFATSHGTSISQLFEEYLLSQYQAADYNEPKKPSVADELFGCAKNGPLRYMTDREIKDLMVKERYGL